jgi:hypothetical protein
MGFAGTGRADRAALGCCNEATNDCSSRCITTDAPALLAQLARASFDRGGSKSRENDIEGDVLAHFGSRVSTVERARIGDVFFPWTTLARRGFRSWDASTMATM